MLDLNPYLSKLRSLLHEHKIEANISEKDFCILGEIVLDNAQTKGPISKAITSMISPPILEGEYFHYTKKSSADSIINSQKIRLTSIQNRVKENEIIELLKTFNYTYPLQNNPETQQQNYLDSLANNIFYISLTETNTSPTEEEKFWRNFADTDGARLKIKVRSPSGRIRKICYGNALDEAAKFFHEITRITREELDKIFFWEDSAVACALHLPEEFLPEKEIRVFARKNHGAPLREENGLEFLELNLGENEEMGINIQLVEVQSNSTLPQIDGVSYVGRA